MKTKKELYKELRRCRKAIVNDTFIGAAGPLSGSLAKANTKQEKLALIDHLLTTS